jgi:hypothetical protein
MGTIDFSGLTDDQLVELVHAACAEAVERGSAVEAAARAAMLSQAERAEILRNAAEREAERIREEERRRLERQAAEAVRAQAEEEARRTATEKEEKLWAAKKKIAQMVVHSLGKGITLTVWQRDGEKRVYLDWENNNRKISYFATGNQWQAPNSLKGENWKPSKEQWKEIRYLVEAAAKGWNTVKIDCDQAMAARVEVPPISEEFAALIRSREEAQEATQREKEASEQHEIRAQFGGDPVLSGYRAAHSDSVLVVRDAEDPSQASLLRCDYSYARRNGHWKFRKEGTLIAPSSVNEWPEEILATINTEGFRDQLAQLPTLTPMKLAQLRGN